VPTLQWIEGAQDTAAFAIAQEVNAVLGGSPMTEAKARVVAWRVLSALGEYVRDVAPGDDEPEPAEPGTVSNGETFS
jgi:hypothetical protein